MTYSEEIKKIVKNAFYRRRHSVENLECHSPISNIWGKWKYKAMYDMKKIKEFCEAQEADFSALEIEWAK